MKNSALTFRWPLRCIAIICFGVGIWQYLSVSPKWTDVYKSDARILNISGDAYNYVSSRGLPRIKVVTKELGVIYFDCLIASEFCSKGVGSKPMQLKAKIINIKYDFYWPIEMQFLYESRWRLEMDTSKYLFDLYAERDGELYKFWLALSLAMLGFSVWFGKRSLLNGN